MPPVWLPALLAAASLLLGMYYTGVPTHRYSEPETERFSCRPFLPKLLLQYPPQSDDPEVKKASQSLRRLFAQKSAHKDIDSLSIAIVGPGGAIFAENYGVRRGNESAQSLPTDMHSTYRVASVSKLFAVLEGQILVQKGVVSWNNPVATYLPDFHPRKDTLSGGRLEDTPLTLFQLASHTTGLGRDWPPGNVPNWPADMVGGGPPPKNGLPFPTHQALYSAIEKNYLVAPPSTWPVYSSTGVALLGMALVAADRQAYGRNEPKTFAELVQRDIFDKIGMNDSHFLTTEENKHQVVVPSAAPEVADQDFLDAMNPAGGQFSSLHDSIVFLHNLLRSGADETSLLTKSTFDGWIHAAHAFEEDDWTEAGFIWEIVKAHDSNGRLRRIYWKLGLLPGYHSAIAMHPGTMYGIALLLAGNYPDADKLVYDAFEIVQPHIDTMLKKLSEELYAGAWKSSDGESDIQIAIDKGTLYVDKLLVNGTDLFRYFKPRPDTDGTALAETVCS